MHMEDDFQSSVEQPLVLAAIPERQASLMRSQSRLSNAVVGGVYNIQWEQMLMEKVGRGR